MALDRRHIKSAENHSHGEHCRGVRHKAVLERLRPGIFFVAAIEYIHAAVKPIVYYIPVGGFEEVTMVIAQTAYYSFALGGVDVEHACFAFVGAVARHADYLEVLGVNQRKKPLAAVQP